MTPIKNPYDEWVPRDYLNEYLNEIQADERATIQYFVDHVRSAPAGPALSFGSGPTLHHAFLLAPWASQIDLADYVAGNLNEIEQWLLNRPEAHDWEPFVRYTLECEGAGAPTRDDVVGRMSELRRRVGRLLHCDATLDDPLGPLLRGAFATVVSAYCCEAVTEDKDLWRRYLRNILSLVRPGGLFLTSAVRHCHQYKCGPRMFPTAYLDEHDIFAALQQDLRLESIDVCVREVPQHVERGFSGIVLACGVKS